MPWTTTESAYALAAGRRNLSFTEESRAQGLPSKAEAVQWYEEAVGFKVDPKELTWAEAFAIYRGAVIMQGIAARYAQRQASSTKAMDYGNAMKPQSEMAFEFVKEVQRKNEEARSGKAKL